MQTGSIRKGCCVSSGVTPDNLAPVDVVWLDRPLKDCVDGSFDLIVASEVLSAGGEIRLMLPDARFSFDALRPPTRLAHAGCA